MGEKDLMVQNKMIELFFFLCLCPVVFKIWTKSP